jgi:DNA-directed RNA polymerase subunit RPC12/RpoP
LEKVSDLARFVEDFQLLGFDVNAVRRLAEWRKSLAKMEIDPDGLEKFIGEKGSFEEQISRLRSEEAAERRKLKLLKETRLRLWNQVASLQSEASRLSCLSTVLKKRRMLLACKYCGMGILAELPTRAAVKNGMIENVWCPYCGRWVQYNPHDILSQIGWLVLPK